MYMNFKNGDTEVHVKYVKLDTLVCYVSERWTGCCMYQVSLAIAVVEVWQCL